MSAKAKSFSETELRQMFATAIVQCRNEAGFSQEKLAEMTGLSTSYISLLERGQRNLTVWSTSRIAGAFDLHLSEFMLIVESI